MLERRHASARRSREPGRREIELHQRMFMGFGAGQFVADAADFDGTNDYATRGATLTGIADSKMFTVAAWIYLEGYQPTHQIVLNNQTVVGGNQNRFVFRQNNNGAGPLQNKLGLGGLTPAGVNHLVASTAVDTPLSQWICFMGSVDMANAANCHIYLGDTASLQQLTYTNDLIDLTLADWSVGGEANGDAKLNGGIAELQFYPGIYIDLSQQSNRRLFYAADGKAVDPTKPGGAIATLGAPAIYMHLNNGEAADNFALNNDGGATGGAFAVHGALSSHASSPTD